MSVSGVFVGIAGQNRQPFKLFAGCLFASHTYGSVSSFRVGDGGTGGAVWPSLFYAPSSERFSLCLPHV